ncbi:hypothetical protein ACFL54_05295 [Planctomycetota bacterium]
MYPSLILIAAKHLFILLICAVIILSARMAVAHAPPLVSLDISITDEKIESRIYIYQKLFDYWMPIEHKNSKKLTALEYGKAKVIVERFFNKWNPICIDGIHVRGSMEELQFKKLSIHEYPLDYVAVNMSYGCKGRPRQVSIVWKHFDAIKDVFWQDIWVMIDAYEKMDGFKLSEREPEIIWHPPVKSGKRPYLPVLESPPQLILPLVSAGIVSTLAVIGPLLYFFRIKRYIAWPLVACCIVLVFGLSGFGRIKIHPPWLPKFRMPDQEQAQYIFESLHRNIYRAFDYTSEDAVYDALSRSVEGEYLDIIYNEVYQSLVLREEGGAVCRIHVINILENQVMFPENLQSKFFHIRCRWQVHGTVSHWGHRHQRINEYMAKYTVCRKNTEWRIAGVQMIEHKRIDDR